MNDNINKIKNFFLVRRKVMFISFFLFVLLLIPWLISILSLKDQPDALIISKLPGSFVNLSGGEVYYEIAGPDDGPVIVFIHGYSSHSFIWEKNFYFFASQGFRVLRYDLYGRGFSAKPQVHNDFSFFRNQLKELLNSQGIQKPLYIISNSMGALVAADFAAAYPDIVTGVAYISPAIGDQLSIVSLFLKIPVIGEYLFHSFGSIVIKQSFKNIFLNVDDYNETVEIFMQPVQYRGYKEALLSSLRHILSSDSKTVYRQVAALGIKSSLLIWGEDDTIVPYNNHRLFIDIFPQIPFYTIADAEHCSQYEQGDEVNQILLEYLTNTNVY